VARAFVGSLQNYAFLEILFKVNDELPLPVETFVRGLVNLLWIGAAPTTTRGEHEPFFSSIYE